jgi:positive regulator of sigma E activity
MADFIEEGIVLSVQGKIAKVKITPKGTCPDSHVGCPVKALAEGREFITDADNSINAPAGQRVVIKIEPSHFYMGLMLVFIMPLVFLIIGYLAGIFIAKLINRQEEFFGYIFMASGFVFSFIPMARFGKYFNPKYSIIEISKNFS